MSKAVGPTYTVAFKRRREYLTNYRKRLALLKSETPRFVVRKTNRMVIAQIVEYTSGSDRTVVNATSADLKKFGWHPRANLPTAYLVGLLCGKLAAKGKIKKAILDTGLSSPRKGSFLFAALKGFKDAGVEIPAGEIQIDDSRISGKHIAEYAKSLAGSEKYALQFGDYVKAHVKPEDMEQLFNDAKQKIMK
jgi:large subunit ribosomal protein L18